MLEMITEHPLITVGVGVGAAAIITLSGIVIASAVKRKKAELKASQVQKVEDDIPTEVSKEAIKAKRIEWTKNRSEEINKDNLFIDYLDSCAVVQSKRKELDSLRKDSEKLQNEITELSVVVENLHSELMDSGVIDSNSESNYDNWKKAKAKLKILQDCLHDFYERINNLSEEISNLEEKRSAASERYKEQLKKFGSRKLN